MRGVIVNWITLLAQICLISAATLPSCPLKDSQCLKTTAQSFVKTLAAGLPDIGAKSLDVLHVDKILVNLAGLNLVITNAEVENLRNSVIDKLSVNMKKKVLHLTYHVDVTLKGKYKASGKLLILPISGDGDTVITLSNMEVKLSMPFEFTKNSEGKDIMDLKSFSLKYVAKGGAHFVLTNLFNGNKELSDGMLNFMNENWKIITEEFGMPILMEAHKVVFDSIKKYVATQPIQIPA